ncbi:hypothetical protein EMIHUDRAFT_242785 [Emiliania huxleyi CCMP1516]|uniref:Protein SDA1 n=2 Tax=Emiliania huxleyi TaxID=2903 RepID=A0A0D3J838_EMIH1|nr:hypothetical protein EMIHUDRAFT_242785 [Emiliania huxleyi CCMP1516]EOD19673.1 hypothetical protein EMIHUDRAFT_242785 [Emiliania huxleyi CCMP1516]|eukprot:XP_005772102.1 hypothetical protein EMIHUDRAFT_242785 [Emiliania huxleyi CCMP1516]
MDATLLADLIEYRKDRDKAVVAAARSLLQLFRDRMPALLHKKYRGKGCDLGEKPDAYGALQVATGVEGAELLSAREARLAAAGKLRRDEDGGPAGEGDTDDGLKQIQEQAARQKGMSKGQKRRLAELADDSRRGGVRTCPMPQSAIEGEAVDPLDIAGVRARKAATREEKLASTVAGREERAAFGRRKKKKTGGSSNQEKKKTKNFIMATKTRQVQNKVKRREELQRRARRSSKKQFRGSVRKGR